MAGPGKDGIKNVGPVTREDWTAWCRSCPEATFFHTPYWAALFEDRYPARFRAATRMIEFEDGSKALVPMVIKRHLSGLFRVACSMPAATYGGWLTPAQMGRGQTEQIMKYLFRYPDLIVRENPLKPAGTSFADPFFIEDSTRIVMLEEGYRKAWERASHAHRKAVRNARRNGLVCHEASGDAHWDAYADMYEESIGRWRLRGIFSGVSYDRGFLRGIREMDPSLRKLWLVSLDGKCIAGIICFYWNSHAVAWHGAGRSSHFSLRPNNLLYDHAIAHAAETGFRWFDCNPSGGLDGVSSFKKLLGAEKVPCRLIVRRSVLSGLLRALRPKS